MPQTSRTLRLSPVLLDGSLAYLVSGDAEELGFLVDALPSALDHDLHRSVRGEATSCHVWPAFASTTAREVHEHLEVAIARSRCCAAFVQEPLVSAVRCGCGQHCAATDSCWGCLDAVPTETVDGHPYCCDCARAVREAVGSADTEPPPAAPDTHVLDAALLEALPGPTEAEQEARALRQLDAREEARNQIALERWEGVGS